MEGELLRSGQDGELKLAEAYDDVNNLDDSSLYEYSKGKKQALFMARNENVSSPPWMCFSKPDFTKEDLTLIVE